MDHFIAATVAELLFDFTAFMAGDASRIDRRIGNQPGADPLTGGGKRNDVLANAPAVEHGFFGVPKVIE